MSVESTNPLAKHFRQPAIHYKLPSGGRFWADGSIDLPLSGEIPIYPMTTRDEITIRTPDALMNGESIVNIIHSCCPNIKDAWKMPSIDVDATLIAIRIASYGQMMDIDTICPNDKCKEENRHSLDLTGVLDSIRSPNYNVPVEIDDLKIKLQPQSYFESNRINLANFEEQRILEVLTNDNLSEDEKMKIYNEHMQNLIKINLQIITLGTEYIETDDGIRVEEQAFINEFYENAPNKIVREVKKRFDEYSAMMALPKPKVSCEACNTEYPIEITFNYTNFFGEAS
jgi:hypothetical protein